MTISKEIYWVSKEANPYSPSKYFRCEIFKLLLNQMISLSAFARFSLTTVLIDSLLNNIIASIPVFRHKLVPIGINIQLSKINLV